MTTSLSSHSMLVPHVAKPAPVSPGLLTWFDRLKAWWLGRRVAKEFARFPYLGRLSLRLGGIPDRIYCRVRGSDLLVLSEIFHEGEYAIIGKWGLAANATVLDLGANVGFATLYFSTFLPQMRAVMVEPDADNCAMIEANCQRQMAEGGVRVVQAFVAAREGMAGIDRSGRSWSFKKIEHPATGTFIACLTIPALLRDAEFDEIDLLKCDVEGTEAELFGDCAQWVHRVKHMIVETHAPYWPEHLYRDLQRAGWDYEVCSEKRSARVAVAALRRRGISA